MANTVPTPRSFSQILGDMIAVAQTRLSLPKLDKGSPVLSLLESAAMSDFRASADVFSFFTASDLDAAKGVALDRQGESENRPRQQEAFASGQVTIVDTRYTKIASKLYAGRPAPLAGATSIDVVDASDMTATGSIYIGRGTANLEGPLAYTAKVNNGAYWTLTLGGGSQTRRYHNQGESVVLAQGGNRSVPAGSTVQTPQGGADSATFSVQYAATIPDGEVSVEGVTVVSRTAGNIGNVPAGAINGFSSAPFPGASATNPAPFTNGRPAEEDEEFREAIRARKFARSGGTPLALPRVVLGITAPDENKRIVSSSLVRRQDRPSILYVDDGTGYEEVDAGVAIEPVVDQATGGEQFFQVLGRPVAKAMVVSLGTAPFPMEAGSVLAVKVGGVLSSHTFAGSDFRSAGAAAAHEIVASVNSSTGLLFHARTADDGTRVVVFAKDEVSDDIEVVVPAEGSDANATLLFPLGRHDTLALFQDDRLLFKDGRLAAIRSAGFADWAALAGNQTLELSVDGTPELTFTFTSQSFVDADTGYSVLGNNSLAAWAKVLDATIPGTSTTVDGAQLVLTSNIGRSDRARLEITGGTLVEAGVFDISEEVGTSSDYTLDRNTGDIVLTEALAEGTRLSLGSTNTRGFIESTDIVPVTLSATGTIYVAVDGEAEVIPTGIGASTTFDVTKPNSGTWGARYRITAVVGTPFSEVVAGDWFILWDPDTDWDAFRGILRVVEAAATYIEFEMEDVGAGPGAGVTFPTAGIAFARYDGQLQALEVPAGTNKTADSFADTLDPLIEGGAATTFQTDRLRLRTNTHGSAGDLAVVAADTEGAKLLLEPGDAIPSNGNHVGSIESGGSEGDAPSFQDLQVASSAAPDALAVVMANISPELMVHGAKNTLIVASKDRFGNNKSFRSSIESIVDGGTSTITTRKSVPGTWADEDRFYLASPFQFSPEDELGVLVDDDVATKRFVAPMWRALRPSDVAYGTTNAFKDIGDGTAPESYLAAAFGEDFNFDDFAVFMRARAKSHSADATKATLWRYYRFGAEGEGVVVAHTYPAAPDLPLAVEMDILPTDAEGTERVNVVLPSSAAKTGYPVRNSSRLGVGYSLTGTLAHVTLALGFAISSATRTGAINVTLTLTLPTGLYNVTNHGLVAGNLVWVQSSSASFPSGLKVIASVAATTITYSEVGANVTVPNIGTVSFDSVGEATFNGATPSAIAVGDLVHIGDSNPLFPVNNQTLKITHLGSQFLQGYAEVNTSGATSNTLLSWTLLGDTELLSFYSLNTASCTASAIAAAVNALDESPVSATLLGAGGGSVVLSSREDLVDVDGGYTLADGLNWVRATTNPPDVTTDYELEFKRSVAAGLVTDSDWDNEEVRIVPTTAKNVADWLGSLAVSGIASVCDVEECDRARRVQISTQTVGSEGSVQVQGGTANASTATVVGTARTGGGYAVASFPTSALGPFRGDRYVALDNALRLPKPGLFSSTTNLSSLTVAGVFDFSAGPSLYTLEGGGQADVALQVEKHGRFVAYVGFGALSCTEGAWLYIATPTTPVANTISAANRGVFRIVRVDLAADTIWVENDAAVEESNKKCDAKFFASTSLMPGDTISISSTLWGAANQGLWTVDFVGNPATGLFTDNTMFRVSVADRAITPVSAVGALGATEATKIVALEASPARLLKRIAAIGPHPTDETLTEVKFDTDDESRLISEAAGTVMSALSKLDFPTEVSQGADGYSQMVGLLGEASRVIYGDARDPDTYPGYIAEGAHVVLSGPLVRRLQFALVVRARTGAARSEVAARVRSSVASFVNGSPIGKPISLSGVVTAAGKVYGVEAVALQSPTYDAAHDIIALQPSEKGLVLNVEQDVTVSFSDE